MAVALLGHWHLRRLLCGDGARVATSADCRGQHTSAKLALTSKPVSCFAIAVVPSPNLSCAIRASTSHEARIVGSEGTIVIDPSWWKGESATLKAGAREECIELPLAGNGYNYEAQEVARCLGEGLTESAVMSLDETVALMRILDEIRAQIGLKYPME